MHRWPQHKQHFAFLSYKTYRLILTRVCKVIDHKGCHKAVRTSTSFSAVMCAIFLFLPHFDVICDLLLNRCTATWSLFVKCKYSHFSLPPTTLCQIEWYRTLLQSYDLHCKKDCHINTGKLQMYNNTAPIIISNPVIYSNVSVLSLTESHG